MFTFRIWIFYKVLLETFNRSQSTHVNNPKNITIRDKTLVCAIIATTPHTQQAVCERKTQTYTTEPANQPVYFVLLCTNRHQQQQQTRSAQLSLLANSPLSTCRNVVHQHNHKARVLWLGCLGGLEDVNKRKRKPADRK